MKILFSLIFLSLLSCKKEDATSQVKHINQIDEDKMLLVLSAPSINNEYYEKAFDAIVQFHVRYAKAVMENDNIIIVADEKTMPYYEKHLPKDVLLKVDLYDIWMRDFTTTNPLSPVQFKYTWASMTQKESEEVQNSFNDFVEKYDINFKSTSYIMDGGNIVDNYAGKIITTTRFLEDNDLIKEEAKSILKSLLNAKEVAIISYDDDVLAHADGMVSWIDENTLLVNDYSFDADFRTEVLDELKSSFPDTKIMEVPFKEVNDAWEGFASSTGINVNSTLTFNNIYVPIYDMPHEKKFFEILEKNTTKKVIKIKANEVSPMGGSVRCLTWQLTGKNAEKLIIAARK